MYITDHEELYSSVVEFYESPEHWRELLGSAPRYFVHTMKNRQHYFAMSKFCVIKGVTAKSYIKTFRHKTDGNNSQKIIAHKLNDEWISHESIDPKIRKAFDKWMKAFFPNYTVENASFISIKAHSSNRTQPRNVTPEELEKLLALQREIGAVGESIAVQYEISRLKDLGIKNAEQSVKQVSKYSSSAGFDILTSTKNEERYIEVKSTTTKKDVLFLSENEVATLEQLEQDSYLYFVRITDFKKKIGYVEQVIKNPIKAFRQDNLLQPVGYKVNLNIA